MGFQPVISRVRHQSFESLRASVWCSCSVGGTFCKLFPHLWFPWYSVKQVWCSWCFYLINLGQFFLASLFPRRQRWEHSLVHFLQGGGLRQEEVRAAVLAVDGRLVATAWFSWLWPLTKNWITTPSPAPMSTEGCSEELTDFKGFGGGKSFI